MTEVIYINCYLLTAVFHKLDNFQWTIILICTKVEMGLMLLNSFASITRVAPVTVNKRWAFGYPILVYNHVIEKLRAIFLDWASSYSAYQIKQSHRLCTTNRANYLKRTCLMCEISF